MPRTAARITQAVIARAIRAAKAEGVAVIEITDGHVRLVLAPQEQCVPSTTPPPAPAGEKPKVVL